MLSNRFHTGAVQPHNKIYTALKVSAFVVFHVCIFPYSVLLTPYPSFSVQMRENMDKKSSEYGHFSHRVSDINPVPNLRKVYPHFTLIKERIKLNKTS